MTMPRDFDGLPRGLTRQPRRPAVPRAVPTTMKQQALLRLTPEERETRVWRPNGQRARLALVAQGSMLRFLGTMSAFAKLPRGSTWRGPK